MNPNLDLLDQLRRLAATQPREAAPHVEQNLVNAFRAQHPQPQRRSHTRIYTWAAAVAALALIAFALFQKFRLTEPPPRFEYVYSAPGFVPLPYAESGVPLESVVVMRVKMRPSEFSSLGVTAPAAAGSAKITADLLVGQDGVPRAVRFVQ
jgi:hypothetical protein